MIEILNEMQKEITQQLTFDFLEQQMLTNNNFKDEENKNQENNKQLDLFK